MKPVPSILIVTDRGHFIAYRHSSGQPPQKIAEEKFEEGNERISDLVTDQAGAFPVAGSSGTSAGENLPLESELEARCFRQIAQHITRILDSENHPLWGLAAPSEINGAILDLLEVRLQEKLALNLKKDLVNLAPAEISRRFTQAREEAAAV